MAPVGQPQPVGRHFAVASPGTATALGAVVVVLVIANIVMSVLDHSLTLSHIGGGAVAAWPTPGWALSSPGTSRPTRWAGS